MAEHKKDPYLEELAKRGQKFDSADFTWPAASGLKEGDQIYIMTALEDGETGDTIEVKIEESVDITSVDVDIMPEKDPFEPPDPNAARQGSVADLREHFTEEATQFAEDLLNNTQNFTMKDGKVSPSDAAIERFVSRLVDHVSNTMLLDPM